MMNSIGHFNMNDENKAYCASISMRKLHGKKMQNEIAIKYSKWLGVSLDMIVFVCLEKTDSLLHFLKTKTPFSEPHIKEKGGFYIYTENKESVEHSIENLKKQFEDCSVILIHENSEYTGGIKVHLKQAFSKAFELCQFEGEDMLLLSEDLKTGVILEHFRDRREDGTKDVYRFAAWQDQ